MVAMPQCNPTRHFRNLFFANLKFDDQFGLMIRFLH
jgi:hypothetical protein